MRQLPAERGHPKANMCHFAGVLPGPLGRTSMTPHPSPEKKERRVRGVMLLRDIVPYTACLPCVRAMLPLARRRWAMSDQPSNHPSAVFGTRACCVAATPGVLRERSRLLGSGCPLAGLHALSRIGHSHKRSQRCSPGGRQGARGAISARDMRCRYAWRPVAMGCEQVCVWELRAAAVPRRTRSPRSPQNVPVSFRGFAAGTPSGVPPSPPKKTSHVPPASWLRPLPQPPIARGGARGALRKGRANLLVSFDTKKC